MRARFRCVVALKTVTAGSGTWRLNAAFEIRTMAMLTSSLAHFWTEAKAWQRVHCINEMFSATMAKKGRAGGREGGDNCLSGRYATNLLQLPGNAMNAKDQQKVPI